MQLRLVIVACLLCPAAVASADAQLVLTGEASFLYAPPVTGTGLIRLTVSGVGDVGDACEDSGKKQFVATFVGELVVAGDGTFAARLLPLEHAIRTPSGCMIDELHVDKVTNIDVDARIGELWGNGVVSELGNGRGALHAQIVFTPQPGPTRI